MGEGHDHTHDEPHQQRWIVTVKNGEMEEVGAEGIAVTNSGDLLFITGGVPILGYAAGQWLVFTEAGYE
jgi:hypothetical protein